MSARSLRVIRLEMLAQLARDVTTGGYLGVGTEAYGAAARAAWRSDPSAATRSSAVDAAARDIAADRARLLELTDEQYEAETRETPLSYWSVSPGEIGEHARRRGLEGRPWRKLLRLTASGVTGQMAGWGWYRIGGDTCLSYTDVEPILGHRLASEQLAPMWAAGVDDWAEADRLTRAAPAQVQS